MQAVSCPVGILGLGNSDPTFKSKERPTYGLGKTFTVRNFNGIAQVLLMLH